MDTTTHPPPDPVALVRRLEPEPIRRRLADLAAERRALIALLRVALAGRRPDRKAVSS